MMWNSIHGRVFEYHTEKWWMRITCFKHSWAESRPQDGERTLRRPGVTNRIRRKTQTHVIYRTLKSGWPTQTKRHWRECGICILWRTIVQQDCNTATESANVSYLYYFEFIISSSAMMLMLVKKADKVFSNLGIALMYLFCGLDSFCGLILRMGN